MIYQRHFIPGRVQVQVQVQVDLFVTYTIIQRVYNQQWNVSQVHSMDSANIIEYNTEEIYIKLYMVVHGWHVAAM